jgi:hypothetical protein
MKKVTKKMLENAIANFNGLCKKQISCSYYDATPRIFVEGNFLFSGTKKQCCDFVNGLNIYEQSK